MDARAKIDREQARRHAQLLARAASGELARALARSRQAERALTVARLGARRTAAV
jgi:hypothetical protein